MGILLIAGDVERIGGIEKYNKDLYVALKCTSKKITILERREGGFVAKVNFLLRIFLHIFKHRPEVILCGHLNFSPVCLFLHLFFGINYTVSLYGIEILESHGWCKRKALSLADKIVTISEYSKSLILEKYPHLNDRIFMLPSSVDGSIFKIKPKKKSLVNKLGIKGRPTILSLARLSTSEHKGQDRVLAAMPFILEKIPNCVYLVVGSGFDSRVDALIKVHPELSNSVVFTGAISSKDRVDYYNLADVYILPSKFEGFGIVFIESLACGVPVIASDGYGCRQALFDGDLGCLVPPDDLDAIANIVSSVLDGSASKHIYDREFLREKTLSIYGIDAWNSRVQSLVNLLLD